MELHIANQQLRRTNQLDIDQAYLELRDYVETHSEARFYPPRTENKTEKLRFIWSQYNYCGIVLYSETELDEDPIKVPGSYEKFSRKELILTTADADGGLVTTELLIGWPIAAGQKQSYRTADSTDLIPEAVFSYAEMWSFTVLVRADVGKLCPYFIIDTGDIAYELTWNIKAIAPSNAETTTSDSPSKNYQKTQLTDSVTPVTFNHAELIVTIVPNDLVLLYLPDSLHTSNEQVLQQLSKPAFSKALRERLGYFAITDIRYTTDTFAVRLQTNHGELVLYVCAQTKYNLEFIGQLEFLSQYPELVTKSEYSENLDLNLLTDGTIVL